MGTWSLAFAAVGVCAACGAPIVPASDEPVAPDASDEPAVDDAGIELVEDEDGGVASDGGSGEVLPDAGPAVILADRAAATVEQPAELPDVHAFLDRYREKIGAWLTEQEGRRIARVVASGTGRADAAALAGYVHERAARELLPAIFDRVGSKQLREDARHLRKAPAGPSDGYGEESSRDVLVNYTLVDFESTECYESDFEGRRRTREYSRRCSIAFAAARLLHEPLDENLSWPEFGSFGNCKGESGYEPEEQMPCFTSGSEGGSLAVLFDLALEIGVSRGKVVAFANKTFEGVVREAAEQTRIAQIRFTPVGSRRLSTVVYDLKRWMTAAEWRRFDKATGIASGDGLSQRAEDELFHRFGKRVLSPLWRKFGTKNARRLAGVLELGLIEDEKLLPFSAICAKVDEDELLDMGEYLQCPQKPEARFDRCMAATDATATFLEVADYWGADDDGPTAEPSARFDGVIASMLDDLLTAGIPRNKLIRELTAVFKKAVRSNRD